MSTPDDFFAVVRILGQELILLAAAHLPLARREAVLEIT